MTTAIKSNNSRIWHLTDDAKNRDQTKTRCNRTLSYPDTDRDGYHFDEISDWPAFKEHPENAWQLCPKCGTLGDFMAASQARWDEQKCRNEAQAQAREAAKQKATDKAAVLSEVWQDTLEVLKAVGWQIGEPSYRRYRATMQVNGFNFEMEFVRPDTAFGVNLATCEVSEIVK